MKWVVALIVIEVIVTTECRLNLKWEGRKKRIITAVPTIGIISKPLKEEGYSTMTNLTQVIEAKYIRYIEGGGGKPIYINYQSTNQELAKMFKKVNGLLFIGGGTDLTKIDDKTKKEVPTQFTKASKFMMDLAIGEFKKGGYFPIWGTCLGFELMLIILGQDYSLLRPGCSCWNYNDILEFTPEASNSRMFSFFSTSQLSKLWSVPMTFNNHDYYATEDDFNKNPYLPKEVRVLSTSKSKNKTLTFISSFEAINYPFYGVQFHPEKNCYDFNPSANTDHSLSGLQTMQTFTVFFVNEARYNNHSFASPEEEASHSAYIGTFGIDAHVGPLYLYPQA